MQVLEKQRERIWYQSEWLSGSVALCTNAPYWYVHNKITGTAQGRGTTWFVQLDKGQGALRHYRRGGLLGKFIRDRYWFQSWEQTRSYQEFQLLLLLDQAGVHVPRPIAASATKGWFCYRADLLSEKIPDAQDLVAILQTQALSEQQYVSIGREIRKMHNAGVNHTDLNIHNLLIDDCHQVWIIDFDKCCTQQGEEWKRDNLARLKRSFYKEQNKRQIHWQEKDWDALISGYQTEDSETNLP